MVHHGADRADGQTIAERLLHIHDEGGKPIGALGHLIARRGARQQQHQIGMFRTAGPDFLAIDDVFVALLLREGPKAGGIGAAGGFRHAKGLQAQFAGGDFRQILLLLLWAAMLQNGAHDVHLRVTGGSIAARGVDFFQNRGGSRKRQARPAKFFRDQRSEPAGIGQRLDEFRRIAAAGIKFTPILAGEARAKLAHFLTDFGMGFLGMMHIHRSGSGFGSD